MTYIVLNPAWVWVSVIVVTWTTVFYLAIIQIGLRHSVMNGLLLVLGLQSIAAVSAVIATSHNQISAFACYTGAYGSLVFPVMVLLELVALGFLSRVWPQRNGVKRYGFYPWLSIWFLFSIVSFFALFRSALLCTV